MMIANAFFSAPSAVDVSVPLHFCFPGFLLFHDPHNPPPDPVSPFWLPAHLTYHFTCPIKGVRGIT